MSAMTTVRQKLPDYDYMILW